MELFEQVMHALEGEDPPRTWETARGPVVVSRAAFVEWMHRIERTDTPTALECVALIKFQISDFDQDAERRIVEGWSAALRAAASAGSVVPRDPVTLLPMQEVPDGWSDWGITLADADKFVAELGMPWTVTAIAEHLLEEANAALLHEHEQVSGGHEVIAKPKAPTATTKLDWKQMARGYATEAWDARRQGSSPSKEALAKMIERRFAAEGVQGRGRLTAENIRREALGTWRKPTGPRKT